MAESARTRAIEATIIASMILAIELFAVASFGASSNQISAGLSSFPSSQNVSQVHVTIVPGSSVDTSLGYGTSTITVVLGVNNTVTWTNDDSEVHTVTSNDGSFDSGMIYSGIPRSPKYTSICRHDAGRFRVLL